MSIIRTKRKKHNFSIIDNTGLLDSSLTWKETGLLAFLMTKPDDWKVSVKHLTSSKKDGRDSVTAALQGLQEKGYVYKLSKRIEGRFDTEYVVFETKDELKEWVESEEGKAAISEQQFHRNGKAVTEKPERENRNGKTVTENPHLLNTDIDTTDPPITEKLITDKSKTPPTPLCETVDVEVMDLPSPNTSALDTVKPETKAQVQSPLMVSSVPPPPNAVEKKSTADRVRQTWEETGVLPKIPLELNAWAFEDIGQDVIQAYRHSGRISTTKKGDIKREFALYVAGTYPGKDIDYGYDRIRSLENNPKSWEVLVSLVAKWKISQQVGDRSINVAKEIDRASKPVIELNFNQF